MTWTSKQLSKALEIEFNSTEIFNTVQFNSQDIKSQDIFIALEGGMRDGHEFVLDALERGAGLAIVSKDIEGAPSNKIIKVESTFEALKDLAEYKRQNSKARFIGITGSVGKTSTKDIIGLMLSAFGKTFISRGNFNNYIGVPINLASMEGDEDFVVMEMGMNKAGEISALTKQVTPDVAIITSVAPAHLEFFESVEKIADAKSEIFEGLDINYGVAILNRDISTYKRCMENIDIAGIGNIKTFGKSEHADVRLKAYSVIDDNQVKLTYKVFGEEVEIVRSLLPKHMAINFAASLTVAYVLGLDTNKAVQSLVEFKPGVGRGRVVEINKNNKKYTIIADYYNANPESMKAGLEYLQQFKNSNKIGILGDMREMGKDTLKFHTLIVPYIVKAEIKKLFLVGEIIPKIASELPKNITVVSFENSEKLANSIDKYIEGGEVIFIKGSLGVQLKKVAETLGVE